MSIKPIIITGLSAVALFLFISDTSVTVKTNLAAPVSLHSVPVINKDDICLFVSDAGTLSEEAPRTPDYPSALSFYSSQNGAENINLSGDKHLDWLIAKSQLAGCAVLVEVTP